jgi:glycosyltransferase involved in cell wall biosynthesis
LGGTKLTIDMRPVGILHVRQGLGNTGGGVERFLVQTLIHLPRFGFEPYILNVGDAFGEDLDPHLKRIIAAPGGRIWSRGVWKELKRVDISLLVVHEPVNLRYLPEFPTGLPALIICHVDHPSSDYYGDVKRFSGRVAAFVGVSDIIVSKLRAALGPTRSANIHKIRYGVDRVRLEDRGSRPDVIRIVYLGRLVNDQKRIMDMVPFVEELEALGVDYSLSIIGSGDEEKSLRDELGRLNAGQRVTLLGALPHSEAMKLLSVADVLVLFSEYEGLPICVLEALSCAVVPVVTRIKSGISEVLEDKHNACLFEVGQPRQAARIIASLAADVELLSRLKNAARKTAADFSVGETMRSYAKLFDEVLRRSSVSERSWDWRNTWRKRAKHGSKRLIRWLVPPETIEATQTLIRPLFSQSR